MNDVASIIAKNRIMSSTSVSQISDDEMVDNLNIVRDEVFSALNAGAKRITRQTYNADTVAGQNEYTIPSADVSDTGLSRMLTVAIKYNENDVLIPVKLHLSWSPIDSEYDDYDHPYCVNRDDSIFVYPAPTANISWALVVEGNYQPLPVTISSTLAQIKLPKERLDILLYWLLAWTFWYKLLIDKEAYYTNKYQDKLNKMMKELWSDIDDAYKEQLPDLSYLE